jgi:signal transduction histidine kinase
VGNMLVPTHKISPQGQPPAKVSCTVNRSSSLPIIPSSLSISGIEEAQLAHSIDVAKRFSRQMAHDFNNILAVIQGFATIMQNRLQQDEANRNLAEQIEASATEALKLTNWLSSFANSQADELIELDLDHVVARFLSCHRDGLPPGIELEIDLEEQLPP